MTDRVESGRQPSKVIVYERLFGSKFNGKRVHVEARQAAVDFAHKASPTYWRPDSDMSAFPPMTVSYRSARYFRHSMAFTMDGKTPERVVWFCNTTDSLKAQELLRKWWFRASHEE